MKSATIRDTLFFGGLVLILGAQATIANAADDWSQWRGPDRAGRSTETGLLMEWPAGGPKQLWTNGDTGLGYGGIAVVDDTLFTMGSFDDEEYLLAINTNDGSEKWRALMGPLLRNNWGDGPRSTPTVVDDHVFAMNAQGHLICVHRESGKQIWSAEMASFGGVLPRWGYAESPLVDENRVIVTPGGTDGNAIIALDKDSGNLLWQSASCEKGQVDQYSSVIVAHPHGKKQYVQLLMKEVVGLDPESGKQLWSASWPGDVAVIPTPIADGNRIYVTSGYGVGCMVLELDSNNEVTEVYRNKIMKNHHGGVILLDEHLYGYSDERGWTCQDLDSGEAIWEDRSLGKGCVTYAGGRLIMLSENSGEVVLVEPSDVAWKERGRFTLEPQSKLRKRMGKIWTHPVVSGGKLFLKDQEILYCYDVSSGE